jgi:hydroxymethylpyrimidine pyrophosphatase-like HAD family hydrolase
MFILPPLIYILAAIVFSLPVYVVSELDNSISTLFLAGGQFIIGMLTLLLIKIRCGKFYLQVKDLKSTTFSKGYLLKAFAGTVISIIAFICITLAVLMLGIKYYSSGFIKVSPNSIELAQKTFEKGDKQVILCGMSHIGKKKFYDQLKTSFPSEGAIILSEGISDSQELLKKRSHYKRMADSFDLTTQPARFSPTIVHRNADIDISEFSPEALKLLKYVMNFHASIDKKDGSLLKNWMIMNEKMSQYSEKEIFQMVKKDFIKKRNKHLLKEISEALLEYNIAIVPWGVAHMPDLEQTLEEQGFTCKEVKYSSLLN